MPSMQENQEIKTNPDFDAILKQVDTSIQKYTKPEPEAKSRLDKSLDRIDKAEESLSPPTAPPDPKLYESDPFKALGSSAGWIAAFGSLLTRQPLTAGLKASAAVMNAAKEGNAESYNQAMEQWKSNDQRIKETMDFIRSNLEDAKTESELRSKAEWLGMPSLATFARMDQGKEFVNNMFRQWDTYEKARQKVRTDLSEKMEIESYVQDGISDALSKNPNMTQEQRDNLALHLRGEAKNIVKGGEAHTMSDEEYSKFKSDPKNIAIADAYAKGVAPSELIRGIGRGAGEKLDAIQKLAVERHPDVDIAAREAEYQGTKSEARALGTQTAKLAAAGREADNLGDLLIDASAEVPRSRFPSVNVALLAAEKGTGDPEVVAYGAALNSYINAYARAINPTGQPRISDKDHARDMLSEAFSHDQVKAVVKQLKKETEAARESPEFVKKMMRSEKPEGNIVEERPIPEKMKNHPDGSTVPDKKGRIWIKQGDKLILQ